MPFGKLYTYPRNPRSTVLFVVAKENGLEIETVLEDPGAGVSQDYLKLNPLGKVPTFHGEDGFVLSECIPIAVYLASQNDKTTLLGKGPQAHASILKWMSFANSEILPNLGAWFRPLTGRDTYIKKNVDAAQAATLKVVGVLEKHLANQTFLVGERLSLADLFATSIIARGFQFVFGKEFRKQHPNVTRWYELIANQPTYIAVAGEVEFIDEAVKYIAPKKEPKKQEPKKETPKAAPKAAAEEEEEEDKPAPKPKHPLETLGKANFVLDEWKRKYSNSDTRGEALPWFWENANLEEYSLWRVTYKYNSELTLIFMSSNLIGGFFARLEASRKYIFGSLSVYGEPNNSVITGSFLVRGQEAPPAFDVAPDWESYEYTKLDSSSPEDRGFIGDTWAWDKPVTVDEKSLNWADGKVFK